MKLLSITLLSPSKHPDKFDLLSKVTGFSKLHMRHGFYPVIVHVKFAVLLAFWNIFSEFILLLACLHGLHFLDDFFEFLTIFTFLNLYIFFKTWACPGYSCVYWLIICPGIYFPKHFQSNIYPFNLTRLQHDSLQKSISNIRISLRVTVNPIYKQLLVN